MPWPDRTKSVSLFQKSVSRPKSLPSKIVAISTIFDLRTDPHGTVTVPFAVGVAVEAPVAEAGGFEALVVWSGLAA